MWRKSLRHVEPRDVGDGAGKFDAGWAAADDDEVQRGMSSRLHHLPLGEFEGQQHAAANLGGIFDGLKAGRKLGPLVSAEVGVRGAGGENEIVVLKLDAGFELHALMRKIETDGLVHQNVDILDGRAQVNGWAARYRPGTAPPARPDRAEAGRDDNFCDLPTLHRPAACPAP